MTALLGTLDGMFGLLVGLANDLPASLYLSVTTVGLAGLRACQSRPLETLRQAAA